MAAHDGMDGGVLVEKAGGAYDGMNEGERRSGQCHWGRGHQVQGQGDLHITWRSGGVTTWQTVGWNDKVGESSSLLNQEGTFPYYSCILLIAGMQRWGKLETPDKTSRPAASSRMIPTPHGETRMDISETVGFFSPPRCAAPRGSACSVAETLASGGLATRHGCRRSAPRGRSIKQALDVRPCCDYVMKCFLSAPSALSGSPLQLAPRSAINNPPPPLRHTILFNPVVRGCRIPRRSARDPIGNAARVASLHRPIQNTRDGFPTFAQVVEVTSTVHVLSASVMKWPNHFSATMARWVPFLDWPEPDFLVRKIRQPLTLAIATLRSSIHTSLQRYRHLRPPLLRVSPACKPWWRSGQGVSLTPRVATGFSHVGIVSGYATWLVFSGMSRFPHPCIPALLYTHIASPSSALNMLLLSAARTSPLKMQDLRAICISLDKVDIVFYHKTMKRFRTMGKHEGQCEYMVAMMRGVWRAYQAALSAAAFPRIKSTWPPRFVCSRSRHRDTGENNTRDQSPVAPTRKALNMRAMLPLLRFPLRMRSATPLEVFPCEQLDEDFESFIPRAPAKCKQAIGSRRRTTNLL
ncbi:hypothetical protein PR048_003131 [Dryococelus australis]|uniref:Uncharacterized protein n=1 Tax=Dryococelus australis TaxID=614101 RepID=A0ABQ9IM60_9NEOP|nr:hypothetical protein PR048_003131 [Dryococelus australis]